MLETPADAPENLGKRRPLRILLAEDNPSNQKLLSMILSRLGYPADSAANGRETIEALRSTPYDVILMDVQMPEMDGLQATKAIRAEFPVENQPSIIALTAHASENDRALCMEAGMDDYLTKPLRRELLEEALHRAYERRYAKSGC
jgi:CheY-like chemotaxis protein